MANKDTIREVAKYLFNKRPPKTERKLTGWRYCHGLGRPVTLDAFITCNSVECNICQSLAKAFKEEFNKQIKQ